MLRELFEKVRVKGKIDLRDEISMRDVLPIVYTGESESSNSTTYYNSGGRSLLFEKGGIAYRVKGVDPLGYLTERIAPSEENRLKNVRDAHEVLRAQLSGRVRREDLGYINDKPFGVFHYEQADREVNALENLGLAYDQFGIENPCKSLFYKDTGFEKNGEKTYQTISRLPSLESDVRVHEYMSLLTERLDQCSTDEIAAKSKNIKRLFGRFIYWAGVNTGILASLGVLPNDESFHPQNWVIGKYGNGYGIFRVDHTSTELTDPRLVAKALTREEHGLPHILNEFSVYPSRIDIASNPGQFLRRANRDLKFSEILELKKGGLKKSVGIDESKIIQAHRNVFGMGVGSLANGVMGPISEEMFLEALE